MARHHDELPHTERSALLVEALQEPVARDAAKETRTLIGACVLTTFFFFVELIGGYYAGSLAIMSDAAHLLSDLAGLMISLLAVAVARLPPNATMSFGFARAEVLGAFVSILFIWALTIVLVIFAIHRLFAPSAVNGPLMLLLGAIGLAVNVVLGVVLGHGHHGHAHGHGHDDDHAHDHQHSEAEHNHAHNDHNHGGHHNDHDHSDDTGHDAPGRDWRSILFGHSIKSVNVRAAYLHVLGDALQNVGVLTAALFITIWPSWSFIDPICTLFFAAIVFMTTAQLARETMAVLMEGTPPGVKLNQIHDLLKDIQGVHRVGDFHVWSITASRPALSVHLYMTAEAAGHEVLKSAQRLLAEKFGIFHATIQVNCDTAECCDDKQNGDSCVSSRDLHLLV